ncbi:MAG: amidohydrolase family protein [Verrucomicrobiae bacterium]|nr:amidohydrolase family protein [Verrucomicrobiae bacterium]
MRIEPTQRVIVRDGKTTLPRVDMHVHLCGATGDGSGCTTDPRYLRSPLFRFMAWHLGISMRRVRQNLAQAYLEGLLAHLRRSSLQKLVVFGHDAIHDDEGRRLDERTQLYVPNDYVFSVCRKNPELLPGVSIHPARPDALEELEKCIELGAVLVKWLPNSQNIDPSNPRYRPFYEKMREAGLPLVAHTGGEHTVRIIRPETTTPACLRLPVEMGVRVVAAHCGTQSGPGEEDYFDVFCELAERYWNFYGDTSAFGIPWRAKYVKRLLDRGLERKILHGSDYPVPCYAWWQWKHLSFSEMARFQRIPSVLERDAAIKARIGMPEDVFTRFWELLPERV